MPGRWWQANYERKKQVTKQEVLQELHAVLRETNAPLPRMESWPAPLSPLQRYLNSAPHSNQGTSNAGSTFASLLGSTVGAGIAGSGAASTLTPLLAQALGGGSASGGSGILGLLGAGLSPVLTGLLGLFGGGGKSAPPPLNLYSAPMPVNQTMAVQGGVVSGGDFNQSGMPRSVASSSQQPQLTLNIQAMDTQSILNRSADIAQAVRQAMLNSHPINDVVADL